MTEHQQPSAPAVKAEPPLNKLAAISSMAAPYAASITLAFIGTLYVAGETYTRLRFEVYGLSRDIVSTTIQSTITVGFLSIASVIMTILAVYAILVVVIEFDGKAPRLPGSLRIASGEVWKRFRVTMVLTLVMSFGLISGLIAFRIESGKPTHSDCHRCSIYFTAQTYYIGNVLGQDGTLTVLRTPDGAVILKTPDITAVQPFDGKPQIPKLRKTVAIPPVSPSTSK